VVWAVVLAPVILVQLRPKYLIRDDTLSVRGKGVRSCYLPNAELTSIHRWRPAGGRGSYLLLTVSADLKIKLADDLWERSLLRAGGPARARRCPGQVAVPAGTAGRGLAAAVR